MRAAVPCEKRATDIEGYDPNQEFALQVSLARGCASAPLTKPNSSYAPEHTRSSPAAQHMRRTAAGRSSARAGQLPVAPQPREPILAARSGPHPRSGLRAGVC